jgi:fructoselysine-6-P-deglycase FrlB-like protein
LDAFEQVRRAYRYNIDAALAWYNRNRATLAEMTKCAVVGKQAGAQTAKEVALKLQETMLIPTCAYEFEEYLHGPSMAMDAQMGGIYLMPDPQDPDYPRMAALAKFHRGVSPMVYTFCGGAELDSEKDCPLRTGADWMTRVFAWVLSGQIPGALLPPRNRPEGAGLALFQKLDAALNIKFEGRI